MPEPLADNVMNKISQASRLYHRLVILVAPTGGGKTSALKAVHNQTSAPLINVSLELSRRMLDLTERQRALGLPHIFSEIVNDLSSEVVLLDNIEIIFDPSLKQDPLRLLQGISRNKTVVAAWDGKIENGHIVYAAPGHPEYKKYPVNDIMIVSTYVNA